MKFPTLVSRLGQSNIQPSLLFFRTSPTSRGTARFLNETRIIPPLAYAACIQALETLRQSTDGAIEVHYADEEGDPYAVELAGKIGAYVIGNDSDFVVLNSEGYLGYIPLEGMVWNVPPIPDDPTLVQEESEFRPARRAKAKRKPINDPRLGRGLIPPDVDSGLTLSFTVYSPSTLAAHLKLPVTLLPLLGALAGNDFSNQAESGRRTVQSLFFERQLSLVRRIDRVATTMQTILSPATQKKKLKHQIGSVMDLIDRTVTALLARTAVTLGTGEVESIVDKVVEATFQYAIPRREENTLGEGQSWTPDICALHKSESCLLVPMLSRRVIDEDSGGSEEDRLALRSLYLNAYRKGRLAPKIMDVLNTGTFWPRLFLENPDIETVGRSIGRPIRLWGYAILDDAVGLPQTETEQQSSAVEESVTTKDAGGGDEGVEDEDELIDVIESDSEESGNGDLLAPLKGALQRLHGSDDEALESETPHRPRSRIVIEYIRRGTRVAHEAVPVTPFNELFPSYSIEPNIPLLLRSEEERFTILLQALKSDIPQVRALLPGQLASVLALRWVLQIIHGRARDTGSKDREKERWTKREARCFLASFSWAASLNTASLSNGDPPPIIDRNVQLVAQVLTALESVEHLAQILLLSDRVSSVAHHLSGRSFHSFLTGTRTLADDSVVPVLWNASEVGLHEGVFGEEFKKI